MESKKTRGRAEKKKPFPTHIQQREQAACLILNPLLYDQLPVGYGSLFSIKAGNRRVYGVSRRTGPSSSTHAYSKAAKAAPARPTVNPTEPAVGTAAAPSAVDELAEPELDEDEDEESSSSSSEEEEEEVDLAAVEVKVAVEEAPAEDESAEVTRVDCAEVWEGMRLDETPAGRSWEVTTEGCEVAAACCEVAAACCEVTASGWPVTAPAELVWSR